MRPDFRILTLLGCFVMFTCFGQEVKPAPPKPTEEIIDFKEEMPRFPGCEEVANLSERQQCAQAKLLAYIYQHVRYPEEAKKQGLEGRAFISFFIERTGKITDISIVRDPGAGMGEAAADAVHQMVRDGIRWVPGSVRFRPVRVQYNLPVVFKLSGASADNRTTITTQETAQDNIKKEIPPPPPPPPPYPPPPATCFDTFRVVEEMPRFYQEDCESCTSLDEKQACAQEALMAFITKHLRYPAAAEENGVQGTCVVTFSVEKNGRINDIRVVRDIGTGCGQETERVIKLMADAGPWIAGKQRGRAVRVQYNLPVKFSLKD